MSAFAGSLTGLPGTLVAHASILLVVLPLLFAPVVALSRRARTAFTITLAVGLACVPLAAILVGMTDEGAVISYHLGGWAPPAGIVFRVDALNALIALLIGLAFVVAVIHACVVAAEEIGAERIPAMCAAFLLCAAGLFGVALTGDVFNMFVFLEISSLSAYALIGLGGWRDRRALGAAFTYLIMGSIGASFFVIGIGFLYGVTGTLNMTDMAVRLLEHGSNPAIHAGFAFILVGLGLKAALFPLHQWLPGAYTHAPSSVTVFLSASATKVALYALIRILFDVFMPGLPFVHNVLTWIVAPLAGAAAVICSLQALCEKDVRAVFAYSSVAQAGYMILAVCVGSQLALMAALFHMLGHAMMKSALFMALDPVVRGRGRVGISDITGAARTAPATMIAFAIAGLSLVGLPLTFGFVSKWRLMEAFLSDGRIWAVIVLAVSSLLAFAYVGRILERVFFGEPLQDAQRVREAPAPILALLCVFALLHVGFGIDSRIPFTLANAGAKAVIASADATGPPSDSSDSSDSGDGQ